MKGIDAVINNTINGERVVADGKGVILAHSLYCMHSISNSERDAFRIELDTLSMNKM